ncbi:NADPH-dependent FMN reductase [Halovivax limisalsi]|uniref:NADPH-dependent FMN reductase n=1 Tax=Halovivax limisalsi TaxID=1453760 RepID=UPI001FFCB977|nr:NAD(P)H-dependent oxidoreductase [Halovivax limisalsi]
MPPSPTVLAVVGSLRDDSYTRTALRYVLDAAADAGAETRLLDLREYDVPVYDPDVGEQGDAAAARRLVRQADAVALGTPVYRGTFSGVLKNFHDYCGADEYEDTTVGLLATAGGGGYGPTLEHLRATVRNVHGWALPHEVGIGNASDAFVADPDAIDGRAFRDPSLRTRVETLGDRLVTYAFIDSERASPTATGD